MIKRRIHDYEMYLSLKTKGISKRLYVYGHREDDTREIFFQELKRGDKVIDIGSNIGYFTLLEAKIVGEEGFVFAVEPDPRNLELLRANIALNQLTAIKIYEVAISNKNGIREFACFERSNLNVILRDGDSINPKCLDIIKIAVIDIYDFLQTTGKVALIRMDVEGHEVAILEGILRLLKDKPSLVPDRILFEAHPWLYCKYLDMKEMLFKLLQNGYTVKTITSSDEKLSSAIRYLGYTPWMVTCSEFHERGIYNHIRDNDALNFICDIGCVRQVLLSRMH